MLAGNFTMGFSILRIILAIALTFNPFIAPAQDDNGPSKSHQLLIDELNSRWYKTQVPAFLEEKKDEEAVFAGAPWPEAILRAILDSDDRQVTKKASEMVDTKLYSSLQHQLKFERLLAVLTAGALVPKDSAIHHSRFGVYLELHRFAKPKAYYWGDSELHFSYELLDREDYHLNPGWNYGNYIPDSAAPLVNRGRLNFYIGEFLHQVEQNEVVFHGQIPLSKLVAIVVPQGKKKSLLHELAKKKIKSPNGMEWSDLIREQLKPPPPHSPSRAKHE